MLRRVGFRVGVGSWHFIVDRAIYTFPQYSSEIPFRIQPLKTALFQSRSIAQQARLSTHKTIQATQWKIHSKEGIATQIVNARARTAHTDPRSTRSFLVYTAIRCSSSKHNPKLSKLEPESKQKVEDSHHISKASNQPQQPTLFDRLPQFPHIHRPTREDVLATATGFWSGLKARFKWFTIRSSRPFNADEIYALFSWIVVGHVVWIIVGTTTFFSLILFFINTVFAQGRHLH
jgi:hypothetical protein